MKQPFFNIIGLAFSLLLCIASPAKAGLITTEYSELVGNQGTVDIHFSHDSGETIHGFSLYFSEALFANLNIISSPLDWDSIVLQPDALLGAGLFDSFNFAGLSSGVARVAFTYISQSPLPALNYDFYDADFAVIESGTATNVTRSVPESSGLMLIFMGLIALGLRARKQREAV
uniref:hypothetical protein n=1 Tax=Cellvibrio fontiphilus TaxID=1815559 RepID=UPI002B4BFAFE|nr:hypothetical protein [Cellvibrio fontiphilus]